MRRNRFTWWRLTSPDPFEAEAEIQVLVTVTNVNDESPKFNVMPPAISLTVAENTARGALLANYAATDADGDTVKYSLKGDEREVVRDIANRRPVDS